MMLRHFSNETCFSIYRQTSDISLYNTYQYIESNNCHFFEYTCSSSISRSRRNNNNINTPTYYMYINEIPEGDENEKVVSFAFSLQKIRFVPSIVLSL